MSKLADQTLAQLSRDRDTAYRIALALEARGLPQSARRQRNAAHVLQFKVARLQKLMERRAAQTTPEGLS
jgi:hypothetical protein